MAADLLARLALDTAGRNEILRIASALPHLVELLSLRHRPSALEAVASPVSHLAYERGEEVIVMKGYKFARAKLAAAAALGCLAVKAAAVLPTVSNEFF